MDLGRKNDQNSVITAAMVSMKVILFLLVVVVAYNLLSAVAAIYESPWSSSHFENDAAGLFVSSFLLLQLMFLLRFPKIRFLLLIAGFCGWVAMTIKLHMPPDAATISLADRAGDWPSVRDIKEIRLFCVVLFIEGIVFIYLTKFIDLILLSAIKWLFSLWCAAKRQKKIEKTSKHV